MKKYAINSVTYSSRLKAQVLYLNNKGVIALERLCTILNELSGGELSIKPSTVTNWMAEFDRKSEDYRSSILDKILRSWVVHVDETGYKINGKQAWIHVLCTNAYAYFVMTKKRKDIEKGPLKLLEQFENVLVHDHYKSYYELKNCEHAECNEHILRALKGGLDFDDIRDCQEMITLLQTALHRKHELQKQGIEQMEEEEIKAIEEKFIEIAERIVNQYEQNHKTIKALYVPEAIKTLRRMIEYKGEHLLFLRDFSVPFDNNPAEREARICKIIKRSQVNAQRWRPDSIRWQCFLYSRPQRSKNRIPWSPLKTS